MSAQSKINFSLRPSKHAERRILAEFFSHLAIFDSLSKYRYIGFGSYYFADFSLFHRQLGFRSMVNIEQDGTNQARYEFNSPYGSIKHIFKKATQALPEIKLGTHRNILWLDYFCHLDGECLQDIELFCSKTPSGSVILITANGRLDLSVKGAADDFRSEFDKEYLTIPAPSLSGWDFHKECVRIIKRKIDRVLLDRVDKQKFRFRPLINISYSDGAEMITYGGIIYSEDEEARAMSPNFSEMDFIRHGEDIFQIECPVLTYREIRHIDACLGAPSGGKFILAKSPIPSKEAAKYINLYRFYPNYFHAEVS